MKEIHAKECDLPDCRALFVGKKGQRFCSRTCSRKWLAIENSKGPKTPIAHATCEGCGCKFKPRLARYSRFCSRECCFKLQRRCRAERESAIEMARLANLPVCPCGKRLKVMGGTYCSGKCYHLATHKPKHLSKTQCCRVCGTTIIIEGRGHGTSGRVYCSKKCSRKASRRIERANGTHRVSCARRAKRLREATIEMINPFKVFERDGWTCWLCGVGCVRGAEHPDSMAATVDHVIPLAKGGEHSYANVRCAHFICNSRKRDRIVEVMGVGG